MPLTDPYPIPDGSMPYFRHADAMAIVRPCIDNRAFAVCCVTGVPGSYRISPPLDISSGLEERSWHTASVQWPTTQWPATAHESGSGIRLGAPQSPYAESSAALDTRGDHQALQRGAGCQYRTTIARRQPVSSRPVLTRWLGHEQVPAKATRPAENRSGHPRGWHSSRLWHGIPPAGRPGL